MENHFDYNYELEHRLTLSRKLDEVKQVESIAEMANIHYVRQKNLGFRTCYIVC